MATVGDAISTIIAGDSPVGSSEPAGPSEYGVLKVSAVGEESFQEQENKALARPADFDSSLEVQPGFLLITRANAMAKGVGRACIVEGTRRGLMLSDKTLRLVVNPDKARDRFLLQALRSRICRRFIEGAANGTEAKNISQAKLRKAPVWLPSLNTQDAALLILDAHAQVAANLRANFESLRNVKNQLLAQVLTGDTHV